MDSNSGKNDYSPHELLHFHIFWIILVRHFAGRLFSVRCARCLSSFWPRARMPPPCFVPPVDLVPADDEACWPSRFEVVTPDASKEPFLLAGVRVIRVGATPPPEVVTASVDDAVRPSLCHFRYVTSLVAAADVTSFLARTGCMRSLFSWMCIPFFCLVVAFVYRKKKIKCSTPMQTF